MEKTRSEYSAINIMTGFTGFLLNTVMGYICRMVFVRCLPPAYLGINGLFSNIISMLSLAELGIGGAIGYSLYKPIAERDHEKVKSLMYYFSKAYRVISVIVTVIGLSILPLLPKLLNGQQGIDDNIYVIYLFFLFNTASSYLFSYRCTLLIASQRNYIVLGVNYIFVILQSIIQIAILLTTHNYILYLSVQTITVFISNIITSKIAVKFFPYLSEGKARKLPKKEKQELFINIKALSVDKLAGLLVNNTDNIAMTYFDGLVSVGIISNYTLLVSTLNSLTSQLFSGLIASVGNLTVLEQDERKYSFFRTLNLANYWIFSWGALGIAFVSSDLVHLCFGEAYVLDPMIPILLAINFYILGMQNAIYTYKNTMGLFRYSQYVLLFTAALNLLFDVVLGRIFGITGIILATILARLLTNAWFEPYVLFRFGFKRNPLKYLTIYMTYVATLCLSGLSCYILCSICHFGLLLNIVLKVMICSIVPNFICFIFYGKTTEGRELLKIASKFIYYIKRKHKIDKI